ncbi:MAG: hypothetical protein AMK69_08955 [Nitrospira bacterium SG8_3]|nr:MAG: hypothetical protein AMK69_08955 [Nitrospira bacterium SG8_3]
MAWILYFPYLHFASILLFFNIMVSFSAEDLPKAAFHFLAGEAYRMRKIWILSVFFIFMGVNSFDFRCNLPDERLYREIKKDQGEVRISQNPVSAQLKIE